MTREELHAEATKLAAEALAPYLNRSLPANPDGTVSDRQASEIDSILASHVRKAELPDIRLIVDREQNFLRTKTITIMPVCSHCGKRIRMLDGLMCVCSCMSP